MPRRADITPRELEADPVHGSKLVTQFINAVMLDGKRSTAERLVYDALAIRWLVQFSRERREKGMQQKIAGELMDAINSQGGAFKKKDDIYRMAQANKAFAHYRW